MDKEKNNKSNLNNIIGWGIVIAIWLVLILGYMFSPKMYFISTGLYNQGSEESKENVKIAMGEENTEKRFRLYFQWYNVIHELGHGLIRYNNGAKNHIVDEEQLVNDFAVAYWKEYGEQEKVDALEDIVNYAVENVGDNYKNNVDYMQLGRDNSTYSSFKNEFFTFNDYGWFQFSSVKHSLEMGRDLETVLSEMGFTNYELSSSKILKYGEINEDVSRKIVKDAIDNFRSWGFEYKDAYQVFDKDPNNNYSRPVTRLFNLFNYVDFKNAF